MCIYNANYVLLLRHMWLRAVVNVWLNTQHVLNYGHPNIKVVDGNKWMVRSNWEIGLINFSRTFCWYTQTIWFSKYITYTWVFVLVYIWGHTAVTEELRAIIAVPPGCTVWVWGQISTTAITLPADLFHDSLPFGHLEVFLHEMTPEAGPAFYLVVPDFTLERFVAD